MERAMKLGAILSAAALVFAGTLGTAVADPGKDESGKGRWRGSDRSYMYDAPRREARSFKQEYDDGNCKYERKLEKSGEYKEEVKCRDGQRPMRY
jgi:hypothetical protein